MQIKDTLFEHFKNNKSNDNYCFEIDTKKNKSFNDIYETVINLSYNDSFQNNSKIIVILPNTIEYVEFFLTSIFCNCVFIPIPYFTSSNEITKISNYIDPDLIITDRIDIEIINNNYIKDNKNKHLYFRSIQKKYEEILTDVASIYYSSGTTGNPKGVMYTHENMVSLISSIIKNFNFNRKDKILTLLPFGHTASINYNILPALMSGCDLFISKGFENLRTTFFNVLHEHKISYVQIVPTILFLLNKINQNVSHLNFSNLKFIGCGSSNLPLVSQIEFIEKFKINVANLYGLSESGPSHLDDPRLQNWEPGSIGIPLDVNECKINTNNEILLKGKNIFKNYYNNNDLYNSVVVNGWFNTGDIGRYDNGKFWYSDRSKDLIIKGGINIVPMEIEEAIYMHDGVLECCVVGKKDIMKGENIIAVICLKKNYKDKNIIMDLKNNCKKYLSNYKIPDEFYIWAELPKTPSNKILRRKVREFYS